MKKTVLKGILFSLFFLCLISVGSAEPDRNNWCNYCIGEGSQIVADDEQVIAAMFNMQRGAGFKGFRLEGSQIIPISVAEFQKNYAKKCSKYMDGLGRIFSNGKLIGGNDTFNPASDPLGDAVYESLPFKSSLASLLQPDQTTPGGECRITVTDDTGCGGVCAFIDRENRVNYIGEVSRGVTGKLPRYVAFRYTTSGYKYPIPAKTYVVLTEKKHPSWAFDGNVFIDRGGSMFIVQPNMPAEKVTSPNGIIAGRELRKQILNYRNSYKMGKAISTLSKKATQLIVDSKNKGKSLNTMPMQAPNDR